MTLPLQGYGVLSAGLYNLPPRKGYGTFGAACNIFPYFLRA
jgi:hypothetical protein